MSDPTPAPTLTGPGYDAPPTADMVREWLRVPASTIDDDQMALILAGELSAQARLCMDDRAAVVTDPWAAELTPAIYRRVGRAIAATGAPLGVVVGNDFGAATLPRWDAEIERYERPYRRPVLG